MMNKDPNTNLNCLRGIKSCRRISAAKFLMGKKTLMTSKVFFVFNQICILFYFIFFTLM